MRLAGVVQRQNVWMRQPRGDLDLAQESLASDEASDVGVQHLDRYLASVPRIVGQVDRRHPAAADLAADVIAAPEQRRRRTDWLPQQRRVLDRRRPDEQAVAELAGGEQ